MVAGVLSKLSKGLGVLSSSVDFGVFFSFIKQKLEDFLLDRLAHIAFPLMGVLMFVRAVFAGLALRNLFKQFKRQDNLPKSRWAFFEAFIFYKAHAPDTLKSTYAVDVIIGFVKSVILSVVCIAGIIGFMAFAASWAPFTFVCAFTFAAVVDLSMAFYCLYEWLTASDPVEAAEYQERFVGYLIGGVTAALLTAGVAVLMVLTFPIASVVWGSITAAACGVMLLTAIAQTGFFSWIKRKVFGKKKADGNDKVALLAGDPLEDSVNHEMTSSDHAVIATQSLEPAMFEGGEPNSDNDPSYIYSSYLDPSNLSRYIKDPSAIQDSQDSVPLSGNCNALLGPSSLSNRSKTEEVAEGQELSASLTLLATLSSESTC